MFIVGKASKSLNALVIRGNKDFQKTSKNKDAVERVTQTNVLATFLGMANYCVNIMKCYYNKINRYGDIGLFQ